ncbi:MAG TPA: RDD family protein, partial [Terracidiphilus sp.]
MSTSQAGLFEWKQEVNRRLAEHRSRKTSPAAGARAAASAAHRDSGSRRGAEAAARVAERFAHAPCYTDTLVDAARSRRAEETRHTADPEIPAIADAFEMPAPAAPQREHKVEIHALPTALETASAGAIPIRQAVEPRENARLFGGSAANLLEPRTSEWSNPIDAEEMPAGESDPMHANLIEFPRELVATRKIRPRLVEGPLAAGRDAQLSIFEVDPETVSTVAEAANATTAADWNAPEWSEIKLEAQPAREIAQAAGSEAPAAAVEIELAPLSRRLLALTVDAALIFAAVLGAGAVFAANSSALPGPREMGFAAIAALVVATAFYELLFFSLAHATPGMRYACIGLWTFGNERPTR